MPNLFDPSVFQRLRFGNLYPGGTPPFIDPSQAAGFDANTDFTPPQTGGYTDVPPPQTLINPVITQQVATPPTQPTTADPNDYDVNARMAQLYQPEHASIDKFNQLSSQYPDIHPSKLRRLGAAIIAGTIGSSGNVHDIPLALQTGQAVREEPQDSAVKDWENQIKPIEQAANIERQNNSNARTAAYQTVSQELRQRAQDLKDKNDMAKAAIAENRAKIYEYKTMHPNAKFDFSGPTVKVADPATGQVTDTGIETGHMSKLDQMNLAGDQKMAQISAAGDQARQTEGVKQTGREAIQNQKGWTTANIPDPDNPGQMIGVRINQDTGDVEPITFKGKDVKGGVTKPGTNAGGGKPESATQTRVRQFNAARELYNTNPELRPFLKIGAPGSNDFQVAPPGKNFFGSPTGPTPEQYQKIRDAIYGPGTATPAGGPNTTANSGAGNKTTVQNPKVGQTIMPPGLDKMAPRDQAIAILKANKKLVNEQTIAHVMAQLGGGG